MSIREEIDQRYGTLYANLDDEFFETINIGTPQQERRLKLGKSAGDFNQKYREIEHNHEAKLVAAGFVENPPEPVRDLAAEIDQMKVDILAVKTKKEF